MPRPKNSSTRSYKLIYEALIDGPKSFGELQKRTRLHRNTLASRLKYLLEKDLVKSYPKVHQTMYEIIKDRKIGVFKSIGWEIPWLDLMMNQNDWKKKWNEDRERHEEWILEKERNARAKEFMDKADAHAEMLLEYESNRKLIETAREVGVEVKYLDVRTNLESPFCLSCLRNEKRFIQSQYDNNSGEVSCTNCGEIMEVRQPVYYEKISKEQPSRFSFDQEQNQEDNK